MNTFDVLELSGDGFRNYLGADDPPSPETRLLDRANLLRLKSAQYRLVLITFTYLYRTLRGKSIAGADATYH